MNNSLLRTFVCIADSKSLSRAAKKLYLTPTAVMKQVDLLEKQLDLTLLRRTNQGISLTDCGKSVYEDAKFVISYWEKALERARRIEGKESHTIRVGTSMLNPCRVFMDLWYRLSDRFPQYKIQIVPFEDDRDGILSVIEKIGKEFDFIVGVCDSTQWLDRCSFLPLGTYKKCVAVPMGHRLSGRKKLKIADLYGETLMMVSRGDSPLNDFLRNDLEQNHPEVHLEDTGHFYDIQVFNRCEEKGNLLLNVECWRDIHPSLVTIPVDWDYTIPYGLLYPKEPKKEVQEFLEAVRTFTDREQDEKRR